MLKTKFKTLKLEEIHETSKEQISSNSKEF